MNTFDLIVVDCSGCLKGQMELPTGWGVHSGIRYDLQDLIDQASGGQPEAVRLLADVVGDRARCPNCAAEYVVQGNLHVTVVAVGAEEGVV